MRILFVNENIGGHATVHAHLRATLAEHHRDVEAEFLDVPPPRLPRRLAGAQVPGLARLDLDLQPLRAQLALSSWVRRRLRARLDPAHPAGPVDALHVYTANAGLCSVELIERLPSVVSTDATNLTNAYRLPYRPPSRFTPTTVRVSHAVERRVYAAATLVAASTAWVAESLRHDYAVDEDRLRLLRFGIQAPDFGPGPAPGTAARGLPRVVFVGHQLGRKGGLRLHRLHQRHLADVCELVLVTSERVPAGRNVRAVTDVTVGSGRLWEVLRDAAVFAFPSPIDQASNAVIEAMAAGLPVVGLAQGAMPELVGPDTGRLVDADDDEALVRALRELATDARLRGELGAAARDRFVADFDARGSTRRLLELLGDARSRAAHRGSRRGSAR